MALLVFRFRGFNRERTLGNCLSLEISCIDAEKGGAGKALTAPQEFCCCPNRLLTN
jgi:hypothetical protein